MLIKLFHKWIPKYLKNLWLFDLEKDPTETTDLSKDHPEIVEQLRQRLNVHRQNSVTPYQGWRGVGNELKTLLNELKSVHDIIGDVRGKGLFLGIEIIRDIETLEPDLTDINKGLLLSPKFFLVFASIFFNSFFFFVCVQCICYRKKNYFY